MSSAKAIANGFPMGAMLATEEVGMHLTPGSHASTFGGTALACAVALATLREIQAALPSARQASQRIVRGIEALRSPRVAGVRGRGMLHGVLLRGVKAGDVVTAARERGLLVNGIGDDVVRLAPALVLGDAEADLGVQRLGAAIAAAPATGTP
jgi:acetylornithine/N-succinyldiaminopimelate aminotransferase